MFFFEYFCKYEKFFEIASATKPGSQVKLMQEKVGKKSLLLFLSDCHEICFPTNTIIILFLTVLSETVMLRKRDFKNTDGNQMRYNQILAVI
jgi:hypothetical protein